MTNKINFQKNTASWADLVARSPDRLQPMASPAVEQRVSSEATRGSGITNALSKIARTNGNFSAANFKPKVADDLRPYNRTIIEQFNKGGAGPAGVRRVTEWGMGLHNLGKSLAAIKLMHAAGVISDARIYNALLEKFENSDDAEQTLWSTDVDAVLHEMRAAGVTPNSGRLS